MNRQTTILALTLALTAAACSDSPTAPGGGTTLDTQQADANLTSLQGFFDSNSWNSFEALGTRIDNSGVAASLVPGLEDVDGSSVAASGRGVARGMLRLLVATQRIPLISNANLGTTFIIDPATGEYAPDPSRTGAPANGVRFILYDVDALGEPDLTSEIGHVDLIDNGATTEGISLRLIAEAGGTTFLDYGVMLSGTASAATITIDGFLASQDGRLDFGFTANANENQGQATFDLDATLDVAAEDLHVALSANGVGTDNNGAFDLNLSIQYGSDSIAIEATGDDTTLSATFRVNGAVFATAQGDPNEPVIVGANGEALTADEIRVLDEIINAAEDLLNFFDGLIEPAGGIIALAVAL